MFFTLTSPGSWISPDSITSTSGRLARVTRASPATLVKATSPQMAAQA